MENCKCSVVNTGIECADVDMSSPLAFAVQDLVNSDGEFNSLDLSGTDQENADVIKAAIENLDPTKRLTVLTGLSSASLVPRELNAETSNFGIVDRIDDFSFFTFTDGMKKNVPTSFAGDLERLFKTCGDKIVYYIDPITKVIGAKTLGDSTDAFGRRIQKNSVIVNPDIKDNSASRGVSITFQEDISETKGNFKGWQLGELAFATLTSSIKTVVIADQGTDANSIVISGTLLYGAVNNPFVYNNTSFTNILVDGSAGSISSGSFDSASGNLTFVMSTPLASGTHEIRINGNGFYSEPITVTIA